MLLFEPNNILKCVQMASQPAKPRPPPAAASGLSGGEATTSNVGGPGGAYPPPPQHLVISDPNRLVPVQITIPAQQGNPNSQPRSLTIQVWCTRCISS